MALTPKPYDGGVQVAAVGRQYAQVAAAQATKALGITGQVGDCVDYLWLFPTTTTPGAVTLFDGAIVIWTWPAGITLGDLRPIFVPLNLRSVSGTWNVTTPAAFTVLAAGIFT